MLIELIVQPGAKRTSCEYVGRNSFDQDVYKLKVHAKPVDGQANDDVIEMLADYLAIAKSKITIKKGHKQKHKLIEIKE